MFRRTSCRSWKVAQGDIMYEFCLHLNADRLGWTNWWPEPQRCTPSTRAHRHVHARTRTCASRRQVNQRYREPGESNAQGMGLGVGGLGERGQVATYLLTRSIDPLSSKGGWGRRGVCVYTGSGASSIQIFIRPRTCITSMNTWTISRRCFTCQTGVRTRECVAPVIFNGFRV